MNRVGLRIVKLLITAYDFLRLIHDGAMVEMKEESLRIRHEQAPTPLSSGKCPAKSPEKYLEKQRTFSSESKHQFMALRPVTPREKSSDKFFAP